MRETFHEVTHLLMVLIAVVSQLQYLHKETESSLHCAKIPVHLAAGMCFEACTQDLFEQNAYNVKFVIINYTIMFHRDQTTWPRTHLTHTWPSTHSAKRVASRVSTLHVPTLMDLVSWIQDGPLLGCFFVFYRQFLPNVIDKPYFTLLCFKLWSISFLMWRKSFLVFGCFHMYFAMTQVWHLIVWTLEQWEVWLWRISVGKTGRKVCRSIILLEVCQNQQRTHNWRFPMAFWIVWLSDCSFSQI